MKMVILRSFIAMLVLSLFILFPLQKSYETSSSGVRESVNMPKIGFFTVGDNVTVTLTITNNSTETKYLNIQEAFRPYQITGSYSGQDWQDKYSYEVGPNSNTVVSHTFIAVFPELWFLQVRVDGFENYTRTGVADPSYANDTAPYVHPSSDRDIRVLANSMNESATAAENNLNEARLQGYVLIGTAVATAALAGSAFWQIFMSRQQIKLSHLPYLTPRFTMDAGNVRLLIVNIGNGNAVDVHLEIHDDKGIKLAPIDRFALSSGEFAHTGIDLEKNKKVKITGTYLDLNDKKHEVDEDYEYPPKKVD